MAAKSYGADANGGFPGIRADKVRTLQQAAGILRPNFMAGRFHPARRFKTTLLIGSDRLGAGGEGATCAGHPNPGTNRPCNSKRRVLPRYAHANEALITWAGW